jgi:hypothetical protein
MAQSHLLALPAQELAVLLDAASKPQFAALFARIPAFRAALDAPIDDMLLKVAHATRQAISEVARNTNHQDDWADDRKLAGRLITQKLAQFEAQRTATAQPIPETDSTACACCGGKRFARVYSKACNSNWFSIPHLGFQVDYTYMPSNMGIPGDGDGPNLSVCLDCGRVQGEQYPLSDDELRGRIAKYEGDLL